MEHTPDAALANMAWTTGSYNCTAGAELTSPQCVKTQVQEKTAEPPTRLRVEGNTPQATPVEVEFVNPPEGARQEVARVPLLVNFKDMFLHRSPCLQQLLLHSRCYSESVRALNIVIFR